MSIISQLHNKFFSWSSAKIQDASPIKIQIELNLLYQQNFGYLQLYFASYAQFSFLDHPGMLHGLT